MLDLRGSSANLVKCKRRHKVTSSPQPLSFNYFFLPYVNKVINKPVARAGVGANMRLQCRGKSCKLFLKKIKCSTPYERSPMGHGSQLQPNVAHPHVQSPHVVPLQTLACPSPLAYHPSSPFAKPSHIKRGCLQHTHSKSLFLLQNPPTFKTTLLPSSRTPFPPFASKMMTIEPIHWRERRFFFKKKKFNS